MKFKFSRISELEYEIILKNSFCSEALIKENETSCELMDEATFKKNLAKKAIQALNGEELILPKLNELLSNRRRVLETLKRFSAVLYPYSDEQVQKEPKRPERVLKDREETGESEQNEETLKEMPLEDLGEETLEETRCIEVIAKNPEVFKKPVEDYLATYTGICNLIIKQSVKSRDFLEELISELANLDTIIMKRHDLAGGMLISLDISPQRLALGLNSKAILEKTRSDTFYIPPVMARKVDGKNLVFHAYRSVDDHPVLFPAFHMEEPEIGTEREAKFRQSTADATKILYDIKKGRQLARFPLSELSEIVKIYVETFPLAQDRLLLIDLGTGRGGLLKLVLDRFINKYSKDLMDERSEWLVILNDAYEEEKTGEEFVRYSTSDRASQFIREVRKVIGDIGKVPNLLKQLQADVCFINRMMDMYARYGFYLVDVTNKIDSLPSAAVEEKEDLELRGKMLIYSKLVRFKDLYNLQRQLLRPEPLREQTALPGVLYNLKKDFFEPRLFSLGDLLDTSRLVVISVFPATKETFFSKLLTKEIHVCASGEEALEEPRYVVFYISKEKEIVDAISEKLGKNA